MQAPYRYAAHYNNFYEFGTDKGDPADCAGDGCTLPPQNGAPLRLIVPWKYGFKRIKSIVKIRLQEMQPKTTWNMIAPEEYGFSANVNPEVDPPGWSQKAEHRLPGTLFSPNPIEARMFNGYAKEVANLYAGMDLRRNF